MRIRFLKNVQVEAIENICCFSGRFDQITKEFNKDEYLDIIKLETLPKEKHKKRYYLVYYGLKTMHPNSFKILKNNIVVVSDNE
jgi:hypothetical protein